MRWAPRLFFGVVLAKRSGRWENRGMTKGQAMTTLYIHCWRCGEPMEVLERDYTHGKVCGQC